MIQVLVAGVVAAQMGAIAFPVSGNAACNKKFSDGMLALHSFMYERAHERFAEAVKADPRCAMARSRGRSTTPPTRRCPRRRWRDCSPPRRKARAMRTTTVSASPTTAT